MAKQYFEMSEKERLYHDRRNVVRNFNRDINRIDRLIAYGRLDAENGAHEKAILSNRYIADTSDIDFRLGMPIRSRQDIFTAQAMAFTGLPRF